MNKRKILASAFCFVVVMAFVLGGCNKSDSTPDEAYTTASVSYVAEVTTTNSVATEAKKTEIKTEAQVTEPPQQVFVPDYNVEVTQDVSNEPCTVNVDGKAYTFYTGDVVNYVFYLKTPEALEDFQATTYYDSSMLELVDTGESAMFPVAKGAVIYNTEMPNCVKFNAVDLSGMDFTAGDNLVSFKFRVLDSGSVAISTTLEYMDSVKSEPYVNDYKIVGDIKYSEEII